MTDWHWLATNGGTSIYANSMIRAFSQTDMEQVLEVWLAASIKAHDFIAPEYWRSQLESMRHTYLPSSEVHVCEQGQTVVGFYALLKIRLLPFLLLLIFREQALGNLSSPMPRPSAAS